MSEDLTGLSRKDLYDRLAAANQEAQKLIVQRDQAALLIAWRVVDGLEQFPDRLVEFRDRDAECNAATKVLKAITDEIQRRREAGEIQ